MATLLPCKDCGHQIPQNTKTCPNCSVNKPSKKDATLRRSLGGVVVLAVIVGGGYLWMQYSDESEPSTSSESSPQRTIVEDAYSVCDAMKGTGLITTCEVRYFNQTIDVRIDTPGSEAREMCAGIVPMVAQQTRRFAGNWNLQIFSPDSGDHPIAVCNLR